ncbi:MAG: hypothetical protein FWD25_01555 [Clostridia bacterium]|nr:hypothetical protein [Clostridia bacterium]
MASKPWLRQVAALLAALMCVGGVAHAQASTVEERVAGLYTNPEVIESLRKGIIPQEWEHMILEGEEWIFDAFRFLASIEDALAWDLRFETDELGLSGRLANMDLIMYSSLGKHNSLQFRMYEGLTEQDARFSYIGYNNNLSWSVLIPREKCKEALIDFVTLSAFCGNPTDKRTDDELTILQNTEESFLRQWRAKYPLLSEMFWSVGRRTTVEADYENGLYTLTTGPYYERICYLLTEAQYKTMADAHAQFRPEEWPAYVLDFVAALGRTPDRILSLSSDNGGSREPILIADYSHNEFYLCVYDAEGFDRTLELDQAIYEAFATQWLPLSPAERTAPMREAFERLSGK